MILTIISRALLLSSSVVPIEQSHPASELTSASSCCSRRSPTLVSFSAFCFIWKCSKEGELYSADMRLPLEEEVEPLRRHCCPKCSDSSLNIGFNGRVCYQRPFCWMKCATAPSLTCVYSSFNTSTSFKGFRWVLWYFLFNWTDADGWETTFR